MKFEFVSIVKVTYHKNGRKSSETTRERFNGQLYDTTRFYSSSGVYFTWIQKPA